MAKQKTQLIFNKITGAYLGSVSYNGSDPNKQTENLGDPEHDAMTYLLRDMDIETETWEGNMTTGSIIPLDDVTPTMDEYTLNSSAKDKIFREYPFHKQINIMTDLLEILLSKVEVEPDEIADFDLMREYIKKIRENNSRYKEAYLNHTDYDYIDKEEYMRRMNDQLDGGLRDVVGRPPVKVETPWRNS